MISILRQLLAVILSAALVSPACAESKTIASDPNNVNGAASYVYDPVGNRTQKTSTLPGFPGATSSYNANDELATDTYDANGNTTASTGLSYAYDFENHLVQQAGLTIVYDGDGNRVSKTSSSGTTQYLVDELNPTGYAQVVDELQNGSVARTYTWGLELIAQSRPQPSPNPALVNYYVFDGHGSVRALTNASGAVTDTYDYDAFGNLLHSTGTTPNNYRFAGEQFVKRVILSHRCRCTSIYMPQPIQLTASIRQEGSIFQRLSAPLPLRA
jgi:YD repeat-containing protein